MRITHRIGGAALLLAAWPALAGAQIVESKTGLVVSASHWASDIGAGVLHAGGNAVDAAVATAFALAVTYPLAGNIGGGGFMVIRMADRTATTIDYRERAPLRSTATMYVGANGEIDRNLTAEGYLAPGVPGTVRGLALAHQRFGKLAWKDLVMPAAELAERGFAVSDEQARMVNWLIDKTRGKYPATVSAYGRADGKPWSPGDSMRLPDLAATLRTIATEGPDAFYRGSIADRIVADMRAHGGIISKEDLAAYQAVERKPVIGNFLGNEVIAMGPPSSGGTAIVEMLNVLARFKIQERPRQAPRTLHLMIETMRRAFLDRAEFLGDPDFGPVPVARLISADHAREVAASIDTTRATPSLTLARDRIPVQAIESDHTTHFSVIDAAGNAVSNTYTLEQAFGSRVVVTGTGVLLNNEMGDFNKKPGVTTTEGDIGTGPNLIAPGKRMLSSMSPVIVTRNGKVLLVTGSPGGRTIINTVLELVLDVTAFGLDVRSAVDARRFHHQWLPDVTTFEPGGIPDSTAAALRAMGHTIKIGGRQGDGHSIYLDPKTGVAEGAADLRSGDSKASK